VLKEVKPKRERFNIRKYHSRGHGQPYLRCEYLIDLPRLVESYCYDKLAEQRERALNYLQERYAELNFGPSEIKEFGTRAEKKINDACGPHLEFRDEYPAEMVDYVRSAQDEALDVAFGLLLDEAQAFAFRRVVGEANYDESDYKDEFDDIVLGFKLFLKERMGIRRNSQPRKRTPDLAREADQLFRERHQRIRAAAKDYTKHKGSPAWPNHIALEDKKRPGKPKIPLIRIKQLADHSPREIALEWAAEEMNRRHSELGATANTIRSFLRMAERKAS
jgi:hypothetical protein